MVSMTTISLLFYIVKFFSSKNGILYADVDPEVGFEELVEVDIA